MLGPLTYLDAALVAVAILSGLLAMYRGFTREVLSILSWVAALAAVLYFVLFHKPAAEELARQYLAGMDAKQGTTIIQIGLGAVIFLIVLVVVHLITARISDAILDSRIGMVDRVLGFVFGAVRGFVLIVIPFMFYESFYPEPGNQVDWVRQSKSLPYIRSTGNAFRTILVRVVPSSLTDPKAGEQQGAVPAPRVTATVALGTRRDGIHHGFVIYGSRSPLRI
ncbi:MAG: CvpA family protein [Hyphomicrobiaceae bacterium]|nr:CvpA family protein [Hyphomicrobiaceae bacterium]